MATVNITLNDVGKAIDVIQNLTDFDYSMALGKACALVERKAKENCPIDTGELRQSIGYEVEGLEGTVGTNLAYAPYVEYGTGLFAEGGDGRQDVPWRYQTPDGEWHTTVGQMPQPFLRPALTDNVEEIMAVIKDELIKGALRNAGL